MKINRYDRESSNGKEINGEMTMNKKTTLTVTFVLALALTAASFTSTAEAQTTLKACQGNSICDIELAGSTPQYKNCQGCGTDIIYCNNRPTSVERVCKSSAGFNAQCASGPQTCGVTGRSDPSSVVKFRVYIPKGIEITSVPETRANIAGRLSEFRITVQNKNPIILDALISAEVSAETRRKLCSSARTESRSSSSRRLPPRARLTATIQ